MTEVKECDRALVAVDSLDAAIATIEQLRERAEKSEAELAKARQKLALLEAGPDDYTPEQSLQFSLERKHEVALKSASDQVSALKHRLERVEEHARRTTAERDEMRDKLDRTLVALEELRVKATPSNGAVKYARRLMDGSQHGQWVVEACEFILSLAPKRRTRLEAAMDAAGKCTGPLVGDEDVVRDVLKAAGIENPDEELP